MEGKIVFISVAVAVFTFIILFSRRIRSNYGSMRPNDAVSKRFQKYEVHPGLNYYTSGPADIPHAIIGVNKTFTLQSKLWKKRNMTYEEMKALVDNMESRVSQLNQTLHGFDIIDKNGTYMGECFFILGISLPVMIGKDNNISIYPPPSDLYDKHEQ